ncbi:MAG TPA: bacteriohopanetetrol glucosamine biosynthesis glycosyltransferase HpnI [Candidatus Cybelea sp.]
MILFIIAIAGAAYLAAAAVCLVAFAQRPLETATEFLPTVTILLPIAGLEPELYENLASFCAQDYDEWYQVVLCLHSHEDAALAVAERIAADFPSRTAIAIGEAAGMLNPKIANLAKPGVELRGEIVVIADSDVRIGRDYLRALAASFASRRVGAATCLYSAMPGPGSIARLGALYIESGFAPSVLVALAVGKLRFCLGASMAVRRGVLEEIGGLAALGQHLADDHRLGELVAESGREVVLSRYVVRTAVTETTLRELWRHELRWARTNLALAPAGYLFSIVTYALPFALIYLAASRNLTWGIPLLAVVAALRVAVHYLARWALRIRRSGDLALILPRDFLSLAEWVASLLGRAVRWRDKEYPRVT